MRKIVVLFLIAMMTIGLTYALIRYVGLQGFLFAWVLNLLLMMCVFNFTEALKSPFMSAYFHEKTWERNGKIYEILGVNFFRKLLVWIGWEKLNKKSNPIEKNTQALRHLHYRTKQSEVGHIIIMLIVLGFNFVVAFRFGIGESVYLLVLNVILNIYPIFLQRYNRPRLNRAITVSQRREV